MISSPRQNVNELQIFIRATRPDIGPPSQTTAQFEAKVINDLTTAKNSILAAEQVEPCNSKYTYYDATCTFQGYINYNF